METTIFISLTASQFAPEKLPDSTPKEAVNSRIQSHAFFSGSEHVKLGGSVFAVKNFWGYNPTHVILREYVLISHDEIRILSTHWFPSIRPAIKPLFLRLGTWPGGVG